MKFFFFIVNRHKTFSVCHLQKLLKEFFMPSVKLFGAYVGCRLLLYEGEKGRRPCVFYGFDLILYVGWNINFLVLS